ncbi:tetratricopeptide repeat protein [uncultured Reyranella sp.]|uniref:tetratricopeptide repeat protein n=1 Tax=uncultured Reyranella sp. TaxID=735512 RepID=UPI0025F6E16F|nr:tetratricopeptide repeat protein [uncultured Reyranella sp.]
MAKTWTFLAILSGVFCTAVAEAPRAQGYEAFYRKCYEDAASDQVITSCTAVISRGLVDRDDLATAYKNRGDAYDDKGLFEQALEDYDRAVRTNPLDAEAFNSRGATYIALERYERAIEDFDQAVRLNPSSAVTLGNRCFARAVLGELEQALSDCNEALRLKQKYPGAYASRAIAYLKLKRYDDAIADYTMLIKSQPDNPYALFGRGVARRMKGDVGGGDGDVAAAASIKPDIAEHMARLGISLGDSR